jgi:putative SOS response-associated peptidase YedK
MEVNDFKIRVHPRLNYFLILGSTGVCGDDSISSMCNRYSLSQNGGRIVSPRFGTVPFDFNPRYNLSPGQSAPVVLVQEGKLVSREMKWGWTTASGVLANVNSETARTFRAALAERRCLVPADGFYEWKDGKPAHPYRIARPTRSLFWFAGLWENEEFTILTRAAGGLVEFIHDREPIAIPASRMDWWLTASIPELCGDDGIPGMGVSNVPLEAYPVTPQVTDPAFESPQCLELIVPAQKDPIQHAIDDPDLRWRDISEPPRQPQYATLLVGDEKTVEGRWDGKAWRLTGPGTPLKWCPPSKFVYRLNAG